MFYLGTHKIEKKMDAYRLIGLEITMRTDQ